MLRLIASPVLLLALTLSAVNVAAAPRPDPDLPGSNDVDHPLLPPPPLAPLPTLPLSTLTTGQPPSLFALWPGELSGGGANSGLRNPPDPHGAVGPAGVIQTVNSRLRYFGRDGSPRWFIDFDRFFEQGGTGPVNYAIDAKALYDNTTHRFYVASLALVFDGTSNTLPDSAFLCLAVSKSSDPTTSSLSSWDVYRLHISGPAGATRYYADYTSVGCDGQGLYVTYNMWTISGAPSVPFGNPDHVGIFIFATSDLLSGNPTFATVNTPIAGGECSALTLQPVSPIGTAEPGDVAYFAETPYCDATHVRLWAVSNPLSPARTLASATVALGISNGGLKTNAPHHQPPGIPSLETLSPWAQGMAFWNDGSMWFCHTATSSGLDRTAVYYYNVATNNWGLVGGTLPTLIEVGAIDAGAGIWNYQPAMGCNVIGDICMTFTQSSASMYPRIMAAGRRSGDSGFSTPMVVEASETYFHARAGDRGRWGDFATVVADPYDNTFWLSHEFAITDEGGFPSVNSWATAWANVFFAGPSAWQLDGTELRSGYTPIAYVDATSDDAGGAIVAWGDHRLSRHGLFAQRITGSGGIASGWAPSGMLIGFAGISGGPVGVEVAKDGSGGAYVAWSISPGGFPGVQRVLPSGSIGASWPQNGVIFNQVSCPPTLALDVTGKVFVATTDYTDVYVHLVSESGTVVWSALVGAGDCPSIVSDGAGGVMVTWVDESANLVGQRLGSSGAEQWTEGGIALATGASAPRVVTDGSGGAVVVFRKNGDLYALRVTSSGSLETGWIAGGTLVTSASNLQTEQRVIATGSGSTLITWTDYRNDATQLSGDIYALRLTGAGDVASGWMSGGGGVCTESQDQRRPVVATDNLGGGVVAWQDGRGIYAQRMTARGYKDPAFPPDGAALCTAAGPQNAPALINAATGVAIAVWEDGRSSPDGTTPNAVFAQRQTYEEVLAQSFAPMPVSLRLDPVTPSPARDVVTIHFGVPQSAAGAPLELAVFDVGGRRIETVQQGPVEPGYHAAQWNLSTQDNGPAANGVYFLRLRVSGATFMRRIVVAR